MSFFEQFSNMQAVAIPCDFHVNWRLFGFLSDPRQAA